MKYQITEQIKLTSTEKQNLVIFPVNIPISYIPKGFRLFQALLYTLKGSSHINAPCRSIEPNIKSNVEILKIVYFQNY